ncbi:hypothetical protein [Streptomyces sp. cmx-4-9]|uniref:hypothetical protein n=1 Tax=Streptomyces sp. cmx-4-9 TaxID=2790941 RepID=UPI00397FF8A5
MQINIAGATQIRHAIQNARSEVLLALPANCAFEGQVDVAAAQLLSAETGVSVKVYVPAAARGTGDLPEYRLTALAKDGMEIHSTHDTTPRMAIVDRSVVVLARNQEDYSHGALIGRELIVTRMLVRSLTAPAPTEQDAAAPEAELHPLSREVLRQLALGSTDETAARQIGMALRTYRRVVSRLMDSLDARSRFQAGYLAAQRDLLL